MKEQRTRLGMQMMLPAVPKEKELNLELVQPGAIRYDELWQAAVRLLAAAPDAGRRPDQGLDQSVRHLEPVTGVRAARPRSVKIRRAVELPALLPAGPAARARQAVPLAASADLGTDQPRASGTVCRPIRSRSRISKRCSTGCTGAVSSCSSAAPGPRSRSSATASSAAICPPIRRGTTAA